MIRFCDKEVCCVPYETLNRRELRSYFLNGNRNEIVCVIDEDGAYKGQITYASLLGNPDLYDAIQNDSVILDDQLWNKSRIYFRDNMSRYGEVVVLPIVDENNQLLCFAYQDEEANREIRMLKELESSEADEKLLDFTDLFPQYDYVTIEGFNELAFFFAQYLKKQGIPVNVKGDLWNAVGVQSECSGLDYRELVINAEGTVPREKDLRLRKLHSVSVEFECIDQIYEANYKTGRIKDAAGTIEYLLEEIRKHKNIVIINGNNTEQAVYDYLISKGLDISCFLSYVKDRNGHLCKPILGKKEILQTMEDPVFIECRSKYSAWDGTVDEYDYMGFERNRQYFLFQDYLDISQNDLNHILTNKKVVLSGDLYLCKKLCRYLKSKNVKEISYLDLLKEYQDTEKKNLIGIPFKGAGDIAKDEILLLVVPCTTNQNISERVLPTRYEKYTEALNEAKLLNYSDYFCNDDVILMMESGVQEKFRKEWKPGGILSGCINARSGNVLFSQLVDGHPNILSMDWGYLKDNLDNICLRLAEVKSSDMLELFSEIYREEAIYECMDMESDQWKKFCSCLSELLATSERFTSQELFVLFHIATARLWEISLPDLSEVILYWEPHMAGRGVNYDHYAKWLWDTEIKKVMLTMVRNHYIRAGSALGGLVKDYLNNIPLNASRGITVFHNIFTYFMDVKEQVEGWKYHTVRFEDLKCKPKEELTLLCEKLDIPWSDSLMETTNRGRAASFGTVTGFDLGPVYNLYEEYLSGFDRMRLALVAAPWQKAYRYPYEDCTAFTRKELQELFLKPFRFESRMSFTDEDEEVECRSEVQKRVNANLWKARRMQLMEAEGTNQ